MNALVPRTGAALLAALLLTTPARAAEPAVKPFVAGSLERIASARAGRPFVLGLWSLGCAHCPEELALLGKMRRRHPQLDLVLVSTDSPVDADAVAAMLARHGLAQAESWVFADEFSERLRFEIDRRWQGELPRTYFHAADGSRRAVSGRLDPEQFEQWIQRHTAAGGPGR